MNGTKDELNMADPNTLTWFLKTVQENFPSEHLYVSLWDHNWGWHAGWFEKDETSESDTMDYTHLYAALKEQSRSLPTIDVLGYDACVASQMEVLHTWRPFADTFVGSQDYVGWGGVDYSIVVSALQENPLLTPQQLTVVIADSMLTDSDDHCASSFNLNATFDELVSHVDTLAGLFIQYLDTIRDTLESIRDQAPQTPHWPDDEFHRDLYGIATGVVANLKEYPDLVDAATNIMRTFDASIIYNNVSSAATARSCQGGKGLTIYWTKSSQRPSMDYLTTSFAQATRWDEFLNAFSLDIHLSVLK